MYWEDANGISFQSDEQMWLPGLERLGQEYTLYGFEENLVNARSNRFVVCSISTKQENFETHVRLVEKTSYNERIHFFDFVERAKN